MPESSGFARCLAARGLVAVPGIPTKSVRGCDPINRTRSWPAPAVDDRGP